MTCDRTYSTRQLRPGQALRRTAPLFVSLACLAALSGSATAGFDFGPLIRITGPSPFAGCTADNVAGQDGTNYPGTEIEPYIDVNPTRLRNLIAGWQQDRWSNGGARGDVSAHTFDGGATWTTVVVPNITKCSGGPWTRASDPWVTFSPNGTAYFMSLAFDPDLPTAFGPNAMLVNRSFNGGQTWTKPIELVVEPAGQILHDKNSMMADPNDSDFAYAVWDRLRDFTLDENPPPAGAAAASRDSLGAGDGAAAARQRALQLRTAGRGPRQAQIFFEGPVVFTRTTDGGDSWEEPRVLYNPGGNAQTINNLIEVTPSGKVIDFFTEILPNAGTRIGLLTSRDKGATFSGPTYANVIATVFGAVTPDEQALVRDASILFDTAVDPDNGNLYLAWQDVRFLGVDQVAFSMSTDGGRSWSTPIKISKTPANANDLREQALIPSIEVGPHGVVAVTYYDFRFDTDDGRELTDHWIIFCAPKWSDCRKSDRWGFEKRLTRVSFDYLNAPEANGLFLGDYMGLAGSDEGFVPAFGLAEGPNRTSIYDRRIRF